jgi:hypothetical protein
MFKRFLRFVRTGDFMKALYGVLIATVSALGLSQAYAAGLDGSTVTFGVYYPTPTTPISQVVSTTVGSGIEFSNIDSLALPGWIVAKADVDVSQSQILIDFDWTGTGASGSFNGYVFEFSGPLNTTILNATLNPLTSLVNGAVTVTFDSNTIWLNLPLSTVNPSSQIVVDVVATAVPEPTTAILLGTGAAALLIARRKRVLHSQ